MTEVEGNPSYKAYVISPPQENQDTQQFFSDVLIEALYLYVPVPFHTTHILTICVSIIPFSIPSHRGQVFYHAEASYAQCCQGLDRNLFMPTIISIAQKTYSIYMPYHPWNFEMASVCQNHDHDSSFDSEQHFFMDAFAGSVLGTRPAEPLVDYPMQDAESCSVMHTTPPIQHECPITKVADEFLKSFCNTESRVMAIDWSANDSLLTVTKINARMREAGFEGTSRSLKTLRYETIFINRLVASIEMSHGTGVASLVFYHIFGASNYRLIRLMNRYGSAKKLLAIRRICENLQVPRLIGNPLPILRIHDLIGEHMPDLQYVSYTLDQCTSLTVGSINVINAAIGYLDVHTPLSIEQDLDFPGFNPQLDFS
ncbi:hypothetical protein COCMIDRAFT_80752 [Bipolaris oryzae ATCC 44560]|uniref:Uncharacterized protein n=1 Tax=Bipolaris oryzae ATCC 44560 TaxID=930090 RepID=W6ZTY6_COCMI|nr:uncharacterized protein COCMIDRAFT_80752 [Bipolaris oryzae ATCC 44560]EUC50989.1 hypothetical protein COCMIDRAFT_80752 [Bipolaris oryzae ATCC 44560]